VISGQVKEKARVDVPFSTIKGNVDKYKGEVFILGGIIVETKNTEEGTIIEVVHTDVDSLGYIIDPDRSSGRFMVIEKGYLDPMIFKKRRQITVAAELIGSRVKKIGEIEYVYPLFELKEIYLWKKERGYYAIPPPYPYPLYWDKYPYWWYDRWYVPYYYTY
jgi:outer membrane lipoprotein